VPRFGCSDCRCASHLHYSERAEEMRQAVSMAHASVSALLKIKPRDQEMVP
jgi:Uri superfamily endonuclease